jgi:hypothetical protein
LQEFSGGCGSVLFSQRDIDILKLLRWCQYIRQADLRAAFSEAELTNLMYLGYVREYKASGVLMLSSQGDALLQGLFGPALPQITRSYHQSAIQRKLRIAQIMLTAYRAGLPVFLSKLGDIVNAPALCLSSVARAQGRNPWGNSRIAAIAAIGDLVCAVHYVCPEIGALMLEDEISGFYNQTANLEKYQRAFIFAGESYPSILKELANCSEADRYKLIRYGDAYEQIRLPIYLLSCDAVGAMQLRMMSAPNYRKRLSLLALNDYYQPPPRQVPEWDAMYQGAPFVVAVDMELRRMDAAIWAARERGYSTVTMVALKAQAEAVLFDRYRDTGLARVFVLTDEVAVEALDGLEINMPAQKPYLTEKGSVVDAPLIQAHRKAGRSSRK